MSLLVDGRICLHQKAPCLGVGSRAGKQWNLFAKWPLGRSFGVPQETQIDPLEPCEASGELSWDALGATGRRLGSQKDTKGASRELKDAYGGPSKTMEKHKKNHRLASGGAL